MCDDSLQSFSRPVPAPLRTYATCQPLWERVRRQFVLAYINQETVVPRPATVTTALYIVSCIVSLIYTKKEGRGRAGLDPLTYRSRGTSSRTFLILLHSLRHDPLHVIQSVLKYWVHLHKQVTDTHGHARIRGTSGSQLLIE